MAEKDKDERGSREVSMGGLERKVSEGTTEIEGPPKKPEDDNPNVRKGR